MAHLKREVGVDEYSKKPEEIRNKDNFLAVKIFVAELISRAKGTDYAHALGNLMGSLGQ